MPHQTFFNIEEEKRQRLIEASLVEFATNDYQSASVSRIVKTISIAKGSIYQYFENKRDLYFFLIDLAEKKKQDALNLHLQDKTGSFFKFFEEVYLASLRYDLKNLSYSCFLQSVSLEQNTEETGNVALRQRQVEISFLKKVLKKRQKGGGLRSDIDLNTQAYLVSQAIQGLPFMLEMRFGIQMTQTLKSGKQKVKLPKSDLKDLLGEISTLLKGGLRNSK